MGDVKSFQERFKELKKKENEKDILIEVCILYSISKVNRRLSNTYCLQDLIRYVEETSAELIDTKRNLQKEKEKAASMQNKEHDIVCPFIPVLFLASANERTNNQAKMKFVSVLIDGDCMKVSQPTTSQSSPIQDIITSIDQNMCINSSPTTLSEKAAKEGTKPPDSSR